MNPNEDAMLREMVEVIVREADPETIILFGSRARGEARPDSDVDLLVVEKAPFSARRSRRKEIYRLTTALRHRPVPKDILVYSRDEFEYWQDSLNHVVGRANREGLVLHERH